MLVKSALNVGYSSNPVGISSTATTAVQAWRTTSLLTTAMSLLHRDSFYAVNRAPRRREDALGQMDSRRSPTFICVTTLPLLPLILSSPIHHIFVFRRTDFTVRVVKLSLRALIPFEKILSEDLNLRTSWGFLAFISQNISSKRRSLVLFYVSPKLDRKSF